MERLESKELASIYSVADIYAATFQRIVSILSAITAERAKQLKRWGVQELPDRVENNDDYTPEEADERARSYKTAATAKPSLVSWQAVLLEEVYEALAETEPDKIIAELIQVAAVAVSWIENLAPRSPMETK